MTPFEYLHPAEQIVAIMNRIYENGMKIGRAHV